jgi:hypothetical protein
LWCWVCTHEHLGEVQKYELNHSHYYPLHRSTTSTKPKSANHRRRAIPASGFDFELIVAGCASSLGVLIVQEGGTVAPPMEVLPFDGITRRLN